MRSTQASTFAACVGVLLPLLLASCLGPPELTTVTSDAGPQVGPQGPPGTPGPEGPQGDAGAPYVPPPENGAGLKLVVTDAKIDANGVATATFRIADGRGSPLDRTGVATDGPVVMSFALASLAVDGAGGPGQYTAYTTQVHKSVDGTKQETLGDADVGGAFSEVGSGQGVYQYRFGTAIPAGYDATKTHTVGVWAHRDFGGKRYVANAVFHFVPAGGGVKVTREEVTTRACNQCHNPLAAAHAADRDRREASLCVLCHTSGTHEPNTGNSLDFATFSHKIHRGNKLGIKPYVLYKGSSADDLSTVWYPGELQNCAMCHQGAQADRWRTTAPSRASCGSCHDATSFDATTPVGMTAHLGGVPVTDAQCANAGCHTPSGSAASVMDAHLTPLTDPGGPKLALTIVSVTQTAPGQTPQLRFNFTVNGAPYDLLASPLPWLAVTLAGPTSDYADAQPVQYALQGPSATGTLVADSGAYLYTFPSAIPLGAKGTYAVGMEATYKPATKAYHPVNPVAYIPVTDAKAVARRTVVERAKCNSCHYELNAHGGTAKSPEYCVMCHTPNTVNDQQVARTEVPLTLANSLNFQVMVHRIHRGTEGQKPYVIGGLPAPTPAAPLGTPIDYGKVRFPGQTKACWACHAATSYMLPLPAGQIPTKMWQALTCNDGPTDPATYCTNRSVLSELFLGPTGSACMACHDSPGAYAHAQAMAGPGGTYEQCEKCHGSGQQFDLQPYHSLAP